MRRWLLLALVAAACGPHKSRLDTSASDTLWDLAPSGTQYALVVSPKGMAAIWNALPQLVTLFDSKDLADLKPKLEQLLQVAFVQPNQSVADIGIAVDRGFASFATSDGKTIVLLPVVDRDKWLASRGGKRGSDGDTLGDRTCRELRGYYACTTDVSLFDKLGKGSLHGKLAPVGIRGEIELYAGDFAPFQSNKGDLVVIAKLERGAIDVRGRWLGKPDGTAASLVGVSAPAVDATGASGFARMNLGPLLGNTGDLPLAGGVTTGQFTKSLRGPIALTVPAGSVDLQVHAPLADPAPASTLVEHCDELPLPRAATQTPGACRLAVQLASPLELDTWVEKNELRVASHKGLAAPGNPAALTAIGRELATGQWTVAFWGRGTLLNATGVTPARGELPPAAARAIHLMALIDELGAGIAFEPGGFTFRLYARTVFENPDDVAGKLAAIDGNAIASGQSTEVAKKLAVAGSPFEMDFTAGQGGLMIPAAVAGVIGGIIGERIAAWLEPDGPEGDAAPPESPEGAEPQAPMDQAQLARLLLVIYREDAIPKWRAAHPGKACPASLEELNGFLEGPPDVPTLTDPWGNRLIVRCDAKSLEVVSAGPDGKPGTADDIHP